MGETDASGSAGVGGHAEGEPVDGGVRGDAHFRREVLDHQALARGNDIEDGIGRTRRVSNDGCLDRLGGGRFGQRGRRGNGQRQERGTSQRGGGGGFHSNLPPAPALRGRRASCVKRGNGRGRFIPQGPRRAPR